MQSFSKTEALRAGWDRFKERPLFLVGLFLITTFISTITENLALAVQSTTASSALNVLDFVIQIVIGMGLTLILLRVYDRVETDYSDLVEPLYLFWKYLSMTVLSLVVVSVGFLLFVIPGIIASIALAFASYLIIDRDLKPVEAMKKSMEITHGHRWNLLLFLLTLALFNVLGALFFGVGLLVTIPVSALATVHVYRWLLNPVHETGIIVSPVAKMLSGFLVLVVIGVIALSAFVLRGTSSDAQVRDNLRLSDLAQIQLAAQFYFNTSEVFPETVEELVPLYVSNIPVDPRTDKAYSYLLYEGGNNFEICTILEASRKKGELYCLFGVELGL